MLKDSPKEWQVPSFPGFPYLVRNSGTKEEKVQQWSLSSLLSYCTVQISKDSKEGCRTKYVTSLWISLFKKCCKTKLFRSDCSIHPKDMIRNYGISTVAIARESSRAPSRNKEISYSAVILLIWRKVLFACQSSRADLLRADHTLGWGSSGRNVGRKRGEAISWWVSCWQVSGPWESCGVSVSLLGEEPEQQEQWCERLLVTPRSRLEQHGPLAAAYAPTCLELSEVCCLISLCNCTANMEHVLKAISLQRR